MKHLHLWWTNSTHGKSRLGKHSSGGGKCLLRLTFQFNINSSSWKSARTTTNISNSGVMLLTHRWSAWFLSPWSCYNIVASESDYTLDWNLYKSHMVLPSLPFQSTPSEGKEYRALNSNDIPGEAFPLISFQSWLPCIWAKKPVVLSLYSIKTVW